MQMVRQRTLLLNISQFRFAEMLDHHGSRRGGQREVNLAQGTQAHGVAICTPIRRPMVVGMTPVVWRYDGVAEASEGILKNDINRLPIQRRLKSSKRISGYSTMSFAESR